MVETYYIDAGAGAGGNGDRASPFGSLGEAVLAGGAAGEYVRYLFCGGQRHGVGGGIVLPAGTAVELGGYGPGAATLVAGSGVISSLSPVVRLEGLCLEIVASETGAALFQGMESLGLSGCTVLCGRAVFAPSAGGMGVRFASRGSRFLVGEELGGPSLVASEGGHPLTLVWENSLVLALSGDALPVRLMARRLVAGCRFPVGSGAGGEWECTDSIPELVSDGSGLLRPCVLA